MKTLDTILAAALDRGVREIVLRPTMGTGDGVPHFQVVVEGRSKNVLRCECGPDAIATLRLALEPDGEDLI